MRNLGLVIDNMLALMPESVVEENQYMFDDLMSSIRYSAPEQMFMWWEETARLLQHIIGDIPDEEWKMQVLSEFSTQPVERIRADVEEHHRLNREMRDTIA
jgi:hypothetical protein